MPPNLYLALVRRSSEGVGTTLLGWDPLVMKAEKPESPEILGILARKKCSLGQKWHSQSCVLSVHCSLGRVRDATIHFQVAKEARELWTWATRLGNLGSQFYKGPSLSWGQAHGWSWLSHFCAGMLTQYPLPLLWAQTPPLLSVSF